MQVFVNQSEMNDAVGDSPRLQVNYSMSVPHRAAPLRPLAVLGKTPTAYGDARRTLPLSELLSKHRQNLQSLFF